MPRTYETKADLIQAEHGLILVEQPHGTTAFDHGKRKAKKVTVDGQEVHDVLMLDATTLGMLRTMLNGLSEKNQEVFLSWSWASMGEMGWECIGKLQQRLSRPRLGATKG